MARHQNNNNNSKRQWADVQQIDGQLEMDDMAVAASFAALAYQPPPVVKDVVKEDTNEIDIDRDEEEKEITQRKTETSPTPTAQDSSSEEESSDEDSDTGNDDDVDDDDGEEEKEENTNKSKQPLNIQKEKAAIAKMNQQEDDQDARIAPKTEHELDPYSTPLTELEETFQFNLTVHETVPTSDDTMEQLLGVAGKIKSHMVLDRTVIVESLVYKDGPSLTPLDEGSLLVFQMPSKEESDAAQPKLVPIGKVFEVFGPVRRPLYTLRLAAAAVPNSKKASKKTSETMTSSSCKTDETTNTERGCKETNSERGGKEATKEPAEENHTVQAESAETSTEESKLPEDEPAVDQSTETEPTAPQSLAAVSSLETPQPKEEDPWSENGAYTTFLANHPSIDIYYVKDDARLIDAETILKMSARGCDASNVYDEEVVNPNDMYFSDDEQEREIKRGKKKKKGGTDAQNGSGGGGRGSGRGNTNLNGGRGGRGAGDRGYHPQHQQQYPAGFHNNAAHNFQQQQQQPYPYQYHPGTVPPPPPARGQPQHGYPHPYPQAGGYPAPAYYPGGPPAPHYGGYPGQPMPGAPGQYPPQVAGYPQHYPPGPHYQQQPYPGHNGSGPPPPPPPPSQQQQQQQQPKQNQSDTVYYNF